MKQRIRELSFWGALLCSSCLWWACRGGDGIPPDLVPAEVARPAQGWEAPSELVWGAWHPVPWDPTAAIALERAFRLQLQGERENAVAVLNLGLVDNPECASLFEARAALYASMGYRRAAARDFEEACDLAPHRSRAWCALGRMRQELGLENEALFALDQATGLGLDDVDVHRTLARVYHGLERRGRAAEHYALALRASEAPPYELLVESSRLFYEGEGTSSEAVDRALARLALELPRDPEVEARMWEVHALLRDLQSRDVETVASGLQALGIEADSLETWTLLSLAAVQLDDPETLAELDGSAAHGRRPKRRRLGQGTEEQR